MSIMNHKLTFWGENKVAQVISLLVFILFAYYIFNKGFRLWYISIFIVLFFSYAYSHSKKIIISWPLLIFSLISFFTFSLSYYLFDRLDNIPQGGPYKTYKNIVNQYVWVMPFLLLPTVYFYFKYSAKIFFRVIYLVLTILFFYSCYIGFDFEFMRGKLAQFYNPIISYDIVFVSLSIVGLSYSFYLKDKKSYLLTILSILSLFVFMLHGSRGTWLIVPIVFLLLTLMYFKSQKKKLLLVNLMLVVFLGVNALIPNSPIFNRIDDFENDKNHIENASYLNSVGARLVMWENAIDLYKKEPLLGVSLYGVEEEQCRLAKQGLLPDCYQHKHNIFFEDLAANGLIGLFGLIISLLSPLLFFIYYLFNRDELVKNLAITGLLFVGSFLLSGLTEYYLFFPHVTYIFFFTTASLMSFIVLRTRKI